MRGLSDVEYSTIVAIDRERLVSISPAMPEKDVIVREAILAVKDVGQQEGCSVVFCGGTALSQAHQLIDRMSEDADFRITVPEGTSRAQARRLLSAVKVEIADHMQDAGFPLIGDMRGRNNNSYLTGEFDYRGRFPRADGGLREYIKLEMTAFTPLSPVSHLSLATVIDRVTGTVTKTETISTISVVDTLADKIVGYLRRASQDRASLTRGAYDERQVHHLYDIHCVFERLSQSQSFDKDAFVQQLSDLVRQVIERDVTTYGHQHKTFADAPNKSLSDEVEYVRDDDTRARYERFCETMIWGDIPAFDDVATTFIDLANDALPTPL